MPIISLSLNDEILQRVEKLRKELGFTGRSELIRAGLRMLIADSVEKDQLEGKIHSVLLLIHDSEAEDFVSELKHEYTDIINAQIHSKTRQNKCLEIFIIEGDAKKVKELANRYITSDKIEYVKLLVP
ncbi:MAG: CopG family ribbon-helix-helix protein [Candidatus Odinarchaeum yellowstonii]|uniref:CopG family ribbon-helix-helix protein n=1 Tax=Odinarchaeota yellowstonii (strain LCB_4) TaxID=1841599 RepID=A0AAF0D1T8_ODILC|nr:MAG: CopG family ribbon-helix-helix protein [Candidatus Odinarchaeum yellowstonii]